jgi:hypothetical protein
VEKIMPDYLLNKEVASIFSINIFAIHGSAYDHSLQERLKPSEEIVFSTSNVGY